MSQPIPHPKNVAGDFYVEESCCTLCGVPFVIAPNLFEVAYINQEPDQCVVKKQPSSPDEVTQMIGVISTSEMRCIRYRGTDKEVQQGLVEMGITNLECVDHPLPQFSGLDQQMEKFMAYAQLDRWQRIAHPPVISSQAEYDLAEQILDELTDSIWSGSTEYQMLAQRISQHMFAWEEANISMPEVTPQQTLKFLMEQHHLKQTDLSELIDQHTLAQILRGERKISKSIAQKLAKFFNTNIEVFL